MLNFLKKKLSGQTEPTPETPPSSEATPPVAPSEAAPSIFSRLKQGLQRTRSSLTEGLADIFLGKKVIDEALMTELETRLITADVGIQTSTQIIEGIRTKLARKQLKDAEALRVALREDLIALLKPCEQPLELTTKPAVVLTIGINGAGKTTTLGKLAHHYQTQHKKVMLAAGDTFRAAAIEQLQVWGERNQVPVIAQHAGADSASVIFDAVNAAKARNVDILLADTAGRLHNKDNLTEELKKVVRVIKKLDETAPHEVLLVLDATTGQNALNQATQFKQALGVTGIVLTKLDGTAKGGIIFAIANALQIPIRFIGIGERVDDLQPFNAEAFVDALLTH